MTSVNVFADLTSQLEMFAIVSSKKLFAGLDF